MSLKTLLITYLIGGLTLPPLVIAGLFYLIFFILPAEISEDPGTDDDLSDIAANESDKLKLTELQDKATDGVKAFKAGWLTVTREYHTFVSNANDKQLVQKNSENKSAYTALYKLVKNSKRKDPPASPSAEGENSSANISKNVRKKNRYFGVLRHGNLFLYKDESQKDVQHVVVLADTVVSMWPRTLQDGELFTKRSSIAIFKKIPKPKSDTPPRSSSASLGDNELTESTLEILETGIITSKNVGFFIYTDTNYEKEDWYFALIKATKRGGPITGTEFDKIDPSIYANPLHFKTADILSLIQTLHSSEGQLHTRWLNALIGRIFLSLQNSDFFENVIKDKILKKLAKINKPEFLDEFQIKKIFVGNSAPFISYPRLIELNPDGTLKVGFHFTYKGKLSLQVATKANINLGSHFKTREVTVILALTLNKLEGPMIVSVKPPPTSRLWYAFEKMPDLDLKIEPIVSQTQLTYGMITKVIENKLRDAIKESLVVPYWDDISFFNTTEEFFRGGIWDTTQRPADHDTHHLDENEKEDLMKNIESEGESIEDVDTATVNTDGGVTSDFDNAEDLASIRSRGTVRSRSSFNGQMQSLPKKKTDPLIGTSDEQFLANGSFVNKPGSSPGSAIVTETVDSVSTQSSKSKAMQIISEETAASKKTITNSLKKIGKWYNEKNKSSSSLDKEEKEPYKPPEMIQSRKSIPSLRNTSTSQTFAQTERKQLTRKVSDNKSIVSEEGKPSVSRRAPQAHTFPAEYLYGLNEQEDTKRDLPPSKIPEMKSPYVNLERVPSIGDADGEEDPPSSPKKINFPKRKPVEEEEDKALSQISNKGTGTSSESLEKSSEDEQVSDGPKASVKVNTVSKETEVVVSLTEPPMLPSRKAPSTTEPAIKAASAPPPLPPREVEESITSPDSKLSKDPSILSLQLREEEQLQQPVNIDGSASKSEVDTDEQLEKDTAAAIAASLADVAKNEGTNI